MNTHATSLRARALFASVALVLAACQGAATPAPTAVPVKPTDAPKPTEAPKPAAGAVTIGLLTDRSASLAIYGPMLENGFAIGLDYATKGTNKVAGKDIKIVIKDAGDKPETGITLAREAIEKDGAKILTGVPSSAVALAVAGLAKDNKVIYNACPAASPDVTGKGFNEYTFRAGRTSIQDALTMGGALLQLGKKFIQIAPDNAFGQGSAAGFYATVKGLGGAFVTNDDAKGSGTVFAPLETTDFTPYINQILDKKADVLIVTWAGAGFVPMFQQMQQLGVFKSMVVATGMGDNATLKAGYSTALGAVGVSVYHYSLFSNPENDYLVKMHKDKFKTPPDLFAECGFNSAVMLVKALEATGGDPDAAKMIKALEGMKFNGPKGEYTVRPEDHVLLQPMPLVKLLNTTDPDFKFVELVKLLKPEETAPPCAVPAELNRCKK
ncbi:MAG TPA: substrate-binding domain-containing protein [Thermoflexales bacterium]|nr:substrate-binding domain-containing protein [Anaerolineae bacterium]HQX08914.1 substrate-binding domain-containing protein [Thermoflexales bacterium]HQY26119.1 substrate-binding domain-containing protein [Thermoflexales bacterium]HQZ53426.1 substrate-binding domain-containing protein [Thermoflexales bacterium]HRA55343.1 substrate-binding domain-containing protein [Thermoflexales bacterium]